MNRCTCRDRVEHEYNPCPRCREDLERECFEYAHGVPEEDADGEE